MSVFNKLSFVLMIFFGFSCLEKDPEILPEIFLESPESVSTSRATIQSRLLKDGTGGIINRGITWSLNPNPDLEDNIEEDPRFYGAYDIKIFGLQPSTTYYIRPFAQNKAGLAFGNEIKIQTQPEQNYSLFDKGPGGGLIFLDLGNYENGWRYMEAIPLVPINSDNVFWFDHQFIPLGTSSSIGSGEINSYTFNQKNRVVNQFSSMQVLANFTQNGYKDWFLPSIDELIEIREKLYLQNLGGFEDAIYWSSTEKDDMMGLLLDFSSGHIFSEFKTQTNRIIAVRLF